MQAISYLIPGTILAFANHLLFKEDKKPLTIIKNLFNFTIVFQLISLGFLRYVLNKNIMIIGGFYTTLDYFKYICFTLLLGTIYLIVKKLLKAKFIFLKAEVNSRWKTRTIRILSTLAFILGTVFIFFGHWFINSVEDITPEQLLFSLKSPILSASSDMFNDVMNIPVFAIVVSTAMFLLITSFPYDVFTKENGSGRRIFSKKTLSGISVILSFLCVIGGGTYFFKELNINKIFKASFNPSNYIEDNYLDPRDVNMTFPREKRNLIHIYWESGENSYLSKALGGYMEENLMPELTTLAMEGVSFSQNDNFGGPDQIYGSSWSVAGFINMDAGIPLKVDLNSKHFGMGGKFLPGTIAIGDILEAQGYNQTLMLGSDADFGGLSAYFKSHGNFNIFDTKAAKAKNLLPQDYNVWWGFEDDKLYEFAKDELLRLNNAGKPFNFTMETADTHFPDGYLSENAETKYDSQYANVIAYSSKELANFIKWIQQQDFYENTTIVITGDHLSMDKAFFQDFDKSYKRSIFNVILNSPVETTNSKNRTFAPFDFFPTILASLNVNIQGDKLGLGTNLFSKERTLLERDGVKEVQNSLEYNSSFFTEELAGDNKESIFINTLVTEK